MSELGDHFSVRLDGMLQSLRELVEIESPSLDKIAVDRMGQKVAQLMEQAGATTERKRRENVADLVLGHWEGESAQSRILILGHMDTVWPLGTLVTRPPRVEGDLFFGPGAFDMKGGIVVALSALRDLTVLGKRPVASVTMLCNGDEEIGSPGSWALIEELSASSDLVLCMEPAIPGGALKTARKGGGSFTVRVKGKAAHAGADHDQGLNAIEEMAHHILMLQALTDYGRGTTLNVGLVKGGSRSNVVPEECEIAVDIRVVSEDEAKRMSEILAGLRPHQSGAEVTVEGSFGRPPMVRDSLMIRTFSQVQSIADRHGISVSEGLSGGGSDGSIAAALGAATVDGLGVDGDGGHAIHEHVFIPSLAERAALVAAILSEWKFSI